MTRTILLADDSVTIQKVIELTFMDEDYSVVAVSSGDDALDKLAAVAPDLVIADVHMPGASGYAVVRRAKELHPGVPAILLVGTFEPFDEREAAASGADAHLKKPFDAQELIGLVGQLLGPAAAEEPAGPPPATESAAPEWPEEPFPIDDPTRGAAAAEGEVFRLDSEPEREPELELELEPAADADFEALLAEPEPEILAEPAGEPEEDLLPVDDSPFSAFAEEEGEPFRLGDDEVAEVAEEELEEDTVVESPFRHAAAAVTAEEALDRAHEQAPSAPLAEPVHVAGFAVAAEEVVEVTEVAEAAPPAAAEAPRGPLSDEDVERIARRLAEVVGERVVREVAWEVIPDLAEVVIKDRLRELEGQID